LAPGLPKNNKGYPDKTVCLPLIKKFPRRTLKDSKILSPTTFKQSYIFNLLNVNNRNRNLITKFDWPQ